MQHDNGFFDAARKSIDNRILLDKKIRHINAERRAGDLQFSVQIGTLFRRNFDRARHKHHANRRFARHCEQFFERGINSRNRPQRGECFAVSRMNVIVFAQIGKFFVRLV